MDQGASGFKKTGKPLAGALVERIYVVIYTALQMKPERPDVFSSLLEAHTALGTPTQQDEINLLGDAYLIAVAGRLVTQGMRYTSTASTDLANSDTTAASLTCLFYQLALYPDCAKKLQQEVDELFAAEAGEVTVGALTKLQYLDAVINETLRLHPPVPSGVQRMTPPEGLRIGDTFVPGNTIVQVPSHTMFRGGCSSSYRNSLL